MYSLTTFDLYEPESLSLLEIFDSYNLPDVYMCHVSCYLMTYDVTELKGFPNSPEVILFFQPEYKFTFSCFQNFLLSTGDVKWTYQNFAR